MSVRRRKRVTRATSPLMYTHKKPNENGYYWCQSSDPTDEAEILFVVNDMAFGMGRSEKYSLDAFPNCTWAGPIQQPVALIPMVTAN